MQTQKARDDSHGGVRSKREPGKKKGADRSAPLTFCSWDFTVAACACNAASGETGTYQIFTRFSGARYNSSPSFTPKAAYQASMLRTTPRTRNSPGL